MKVCNAVCALTFIVVCYGSSYNPYAEKRSFGELSKRYCSECYYFVLLLYVPNSKINFFIFLIGLKTSCDRYEQKIHGHYNLFKISDVENAQPNGYLVRFPFYMVGVDDFNVVFTTSDHQTSAFSQDDAYEAGERIWIMCQLRF